MSQAMSGHNSKILSEERQAEQELACNCIGGLTNCPVEGKCQTTGVVYQASVKEITTGKIETYTGVTARRFKDRLYEHRADMNSEEGRTKKVLCAHI